MEFALLSLEHPLLSLNLGEEYTIIHSVLTTWNTHLNRQVAIEMSNLQKQRQLNY